MVRPIAELIKDKLTKEELELVPKSYDIVGSREKLVAIAEISEGLENKKHLIGEAILKLNKNMRSVLNKLSERKGEHRLYDYELIAGDANTEVIHKEHGYSLRLDPKKVFFSPRELTERLRVASQVKTGETVLVMFSGVAPYPICIAKKQPNVNKVYGIEVNQDAHKYAEENVRINKLSHKIVLINGDVKEVCPRLKIKFDRIALPLAKEGYRYLDVAVSCLKEGGIIHLYYVANETDLFSEAEKIMKDVCEKLDKRVAVINRKVVLPWGSRKYKICLDVRILG